MKVNKYNVDRNNNRTILYMGDVGMVLEITNGKIKGTRENGMLAFKNIPFAKPPIGELRFKPPVPVEDWTGVLDCTQSVSYTHLSYTFCAGWSIIWTLHH